MKLQDPHYKNLRLKDVHNFSEPNIKVTLPEKKKQYREMLLYLIKGNMQRFS